jgi:replication factor C subunit 1
VKVDDDDDTDDIFNAEYGKRGKDKSDAYAEGKKPRRSSKTTKEEESDDFGDDDVQMKDLDADDEVIKPSKSTANSGKAMNRSKKSPAKAGRKRKSTDLEDEDDFLSDEPKSTKSKPPAKKPRRPSKKEDKIESKEIQDIYDSIPTIRAPTPPPRDEDKKFNFANRAANSQPPPGAGSKEIPIGAENCLAGLTFVFTGVLDSISREDGQALVKRYGGKVTSGPSSKTSYVVLGNDAGPKKLETIQKFKLKTINEDGLFELIRRLPANGGDGKAAEKYQEKQEKEQEKIQQMAAEIEAAEKKAKAEHAKIERAKAAANSNKSVGSSIAGRPTKSAPDPNDQLWTVKYAPTSMQMICGNKGQVEKLQTWLRNWRSNAKTKFHKAGPSGTGVFRAVMIYGPPGIGKTTAAHLVAKMEGYDVVETNASDTRSKKLVEGGLQGVLDTTSLMGYFAGDGRKVSADKKKLVLIMDEVDGMSAGDRGGVGALASIAKKTNVPLILICNERKQPKMKPFDHVTYDLQFRKPTTEQVRARMMTICFREGVKIPTQVLDSLIEGSGADIRRIINMISTAKLDQQTMDYDQSKDMNKAWEKNIILKPWDLASKILSPSMFSAASKATLNDKTELYFNDHEFSFLMLQENYLRPNPSLASNYEGNERKLKLLELADNAAESFSDGDLIDRMIHGTQQHWSLMPSHAVASFVRPASFMHGPMMEGITFTKWLGQNSKQGISEPGRLSDLSLTNLR